MMQRKQEKVIQYETFLNEILKEDLRKLVEERDKTCEQIAEYLQLKNAIEGIKASDLNKEQLKTKVDLGCNFYVQANIPDAKKIFVCVGFGFFLELTLEEALNFIEKKTKRMNERVDNLTQDISKVKAHIKLVLEGLRELQDIPSESPKEYRDVLS